MNFHFLKLKASTLCAGGTLLVFGGFMTVNLAGCGGGGGSQLSSPAASSVNATFNILQQDGSASSGGTVTLTRNGKTLTASADSSGTATINNITPGTYNVAFTVFDNTGTALGSTTRSITIMRNGVQTYALVQGDTGNGAFTVTGRVVSNIDDGTGDFSVANCTSSSSPISAPVLISVRDLNAPDDMPIIAQLVRPSQSSSGSSVGRYSISLPYRPRSFRVEVGPVSTSATQYAGISATTTFNETRTTIGNVNVCTNSNGVFPGPEVTPTPIVTSPVFSTPFPVGSGTPQPTLTAAPTNTPVSTATPAPSATIAPTAPVATPVFTPITPVVPTSIGGVGSNTPVPGVGGS